MVLEDLCNEKWNLSFFFTTNRKLCGSISSFSHTGNHKCHSTKRQCLEYACYFIALAGIWIGNAPWYVQDDKL